MFIAYICDVCMWCTCVVCVWYPWYVCVKYVWCVCDVYCVCVWYLHICICKCTLGGQRRMLDVLFYHFVLLP